MEKPDAVRQAKDFGAFAGHFERLLRQVHGGYLRAIACEIHRIGADAAADFQNAFVPPAGKFGKLRDVRFDEIFSLLDFIKILAGSRRLGRVANIAWPAVPVIADLVDGDLFKSWSVQRSPVCLSPSANLYWRGKRDHFRSFTELLLDTIGATICLG